MQSHGFDGHKRKNRKILGVQAFSPVKFEECCLKNGFILQEVHIIYKGSYFIRTPTTTWDRLQASASLNL